MTRPLRVDERAEGVVAAVHGRGDGLVLACIDGFMASGKSTLARAVAERSPENLTLVHTDELYHPEERDWRSWSPREGYLRHLDHRHFRESSGGPATVRRCPAGPVRRRPAAVTPEGWAQRDASASLNVCEGRMTSEALASSGR